jgi:response regulator RpfG family c-di-GMP phosphodiesterase
VGLADLGAGGELTNLAHGPTANSSYSPHLSYNCVVEGGAGDVFLCANRILNRSLLAVNAELERNLTTRDSSLVEARNALVLGLAKLVEHPDTESGAHLVRLQRSTRCLAEEAASSPQFAGQIDAHFIDILECCTPLHDIGKVALPDHILLKPGKLTPGEQILMQTHTTIGADTLKEVAKQHGFALAFLQTAMEIARHHHERYDGNGYPDRLAGDAILPCRRGW